MDAVAGVTHAGIRASATAALTPFPIEADARPPFPAALTGRVHSWCQATDPVCAFDLSRVPGCAGGNVFKINDAVTAGLECLRTFLGPHFHYREAGMTEAAGAWLADRITGARGRTTPSVPLPPATVPSVVASAPAPVPAPRTTTSGRSAPSTPPTVSVAPPAVEIDPNPPPAQDPGQEPLPAGARPLGTVDLNLYCSHWPGRRAAARYPNTWGWRCVLDPTGGWRSSDQNISVQEACAEQYGAGAISHYDDYLQKGSWRCWRYGA